MRTIKITILGRSAPRLPERLRGHLPNGVPGERDAAKDNRARGATPRGKALARHYSQLVRPDALNVFGFGTFFAGNDVKRHFIPFVQGLETLADDGAVVNEDVLA
jgi:hypothetical protein